ncbi:MAG TPA: ABC transporter permease [Candidatus Acidoferrales bacterium]|nr:ABC transporter permease [Candidatus Acidoferrales bacterium]
MPDWKQFVRERLGSLGVSGPREQEIVEEIAQQLEQVYADALARGASEAGAQQVAAATVPDWAGLAREIRLAERPIAARAASHLPEHWQPAAQEERLRERRGGNMLADIVQDLRFAMRMLRKNWSFAALVAVTLALGIGANSTIFSVVYAVLLRPLPYPDSKDLVYIRESNVAKGWPSFSVSPANFLDWRAQNRSFEQTVALANGTFNYAGGEYPVQWEGLSATQGFFEMLRSRPAFGRTFGEGDFQPGRDHVLVISDGLWRSAFGADRGAVGKSITLDGEAYEIIGVMPGDFQFGGLKTSLWLPFVIGDSLKTVRGAHFLNTMARLRPGVTLEQARDDMSNIGRQLEKQYQDTNGGWGVVVTRAQEAAGRSVRPALLVLLGAVGLVLLIACANAANMLLARATVRYREIALRHALGASRLRLLRQLLTESVVIALGGGLLGLLVAIWSVRTLAALHPAFLPRSQSVTVDWHVLLFTLALAMATGIAFGLAPGLVVVGGNLSEALKEGGRSAAGGRGRLRQMLVVAEVALAFVLLFSAGLFVRSFDRLTAVEPGFRTGGTLAFDVSLPRAHYSSEVQQRAFYEQAQQHMAALPGVDSVVMTSLVPMSGDDEMYSLGLAGQADSESSPSALYYLVTPGYFRATGIRLLAGREFTSEDSATAPHVCVINDLMARGLFPGRDPIGQRIQIGRNYAIVREIVGVAASVNHYGLDEKAGMQVYEAFAQMPRRSMTFLVRTGGDPMSMLAAARHVVQQLDPQQPVTNPTTLEDVVSESVALPRWRTVLLGLFAGLAVLLSLVGLYGVMSYTVTQQTQEIGVRMAMGAQRWDVQRLILSRGMGLVAAGVGIGVVTAFATGKFLATFLFGVTAHDPATLAAAALLFGAVAAVACWAPARRATRVDPLHALRYE